MSTFKHENVIISNYKKDGVTISTGIGEKIDLKPDQLKAVYKQLQFIETLNNF